MNEEKLERLERDLREASDELVEAKQKVDEMSARISNIALELRDAPLWKALELGIVKFNFQAPRGLKNKMVVRSYFEQSK